MKVSKSEARDSIEDYFSKVHLDKDKTRKMKRLAMKFKIALGKNRQRFCKKCYADLINAKTRITKTHKLITCTCGYTNKIRITIS